MRVTEFCLSRGPEASSALRRPRLKTSPLDATRRTSVALDSRCGQWSFECCILQTLGPINCTRMTQFSLACRGVATEPATRFVNWVPDLTGLQGPCSIFSRLHTPRLCFGPLRGPQPVNLQLICPQPLCCVKVPLQNSPSSNLLFHSSSSHFSSTSVLCMCPDMRSSLCAHATDSLTDRHSFFNCRGIGFVCFALCQMVSAKGAVLICQVSTAPKIENGEL